MAHHRVFQMYFIVLLAPQAEYHIIPLYKRKGHIYVRYLHNLFMEQVQWCNFFRWHVCRTIKTCHMLSTLQWYQGLNF